MGRYTTFHLENLSCAHCAAKMEDKIRELEGVEDVSITFATKEMRVTAKNAEALLPQIQALCTAIEPDVKVVPPTSKKTEPVEEESSKKDLVIIGIGAVLFALGLLTGAMPLVSLACYGIAYVLLGWEVLKNAAKNLFRGQMLDENFLMSIATIGAIVLGEYGEAVGVMLF